MISLAVGLCNV